MHRPCLNKTLHQDIGSESRPSPAEWKVEESADIEVFVPMSMVLGRQCLTAAPFIPSHSVVAIRKNALFRESKRWSPAVHPWRTTLEQPFPSKKRNIVHVRGLLCWDFLLWPENI